jgi:translocation and assembly module TamA
MTPSNKSKLLQIIQIIFCFFLVISLYTPRLLWAAPAPTFQITGLTDPLLTNIKQRLNELSKDKALSSFTEDELKAQIEKAMYPYGFFKPSIQIVTEKNNTLVIHINPETPLRITHLSVSIVGEGRDNVALQNTLRKFPLHVGDTLNSLEYDAAKQTLMTTALQEGYKDATFDKAEILINKSLYTSDITLVFNTGTQYFFGQVRFDPSYISPKLLARYIPFHYGNPFSNTDILAFNDALTSSGYFKSVTIKPLPPENHNVPLNVHLEPAARINYSLGLGYGTDTGPRGQLGLHVVPVNPLGHKFNAVALGSFKENTIKSQYVIPGTVPMNDQYEITGSLSNFHYKSGYSNSALLSLGKRHNLPDFQSFFAINNLYERFHYSDAPNEDVFSFYPQATLSWIQKSDLLFSPNGYAITLDGFVANRSILSQINFAQTSLDAKGAFMLEPIRTRLMLHGLVGFTGIKNIDTMPLSLALLLGGSDNLKGYAYNSLGPGKTVNYAGFEIQKETKPKWYLLGFLDTGAIYDPNPYRQLSDAGLGLMWLSPLGPIKVAVAQPMENDHFGFDFHKRPQLVIKMGSDL